MVFGGNYSLRLVSSWCRAEPNFGMAASELRMSIACA